MCIGAVGLAGADCYWVPVGLSEHSYNAALCSTRRMLLGIHCMTIIKKNLNKRNKRWGG